MSSGWLVLRLSYAATLKAAGHGRVSLARLIEEHAADTGLWDLWENLVGDCEYARSTTLNKRCAIAIRNCQRCSCRASKPERRGLRSRAHLYPSLGVGKAGSSGARCCGRGRRGRIGGGKSNLTTVLGCRVRAV